MSNPEAIQYYSSMRLKLWPEISKRGNITRILSLILVCTISKSKKNVVILSLLKV